uniref:Tetratricopeptide repeat protein n=1 Tax=Meloidogyne incognita TaxID=6306 RepID=A0A914N707_MELIC
MSEANSPALAQIHYWIREDYFGTALRKMDEFGDREVGREGECHWKILRAFCIVRLGRSSEAMRLLNIMLRDESMAEYKLSTLHALRIAHCSEKKIDREALRELDRQIQTLWSQQIPERGAFTATTLLLLDRQFERARPLLDKLSSQSNSSFLSLRGWLELLSGKVSQSTLENFDRAIALDKNVEAFLGKAHLFKIRQNIIDMESTLNSLLNANSSVLPAYVELAKASAMNRHWETMAEICQKAALIQSDCLPILFLDFVYSYLILGDIQGEQILTEFVDAMLLTEASNQSQFLRIGSLLASIALDRKNITTQAKRLVDAALGIRQNSQALLLKSNLSLAEGDIRQASQLALRAVESGSNIENEKGLNNEDNQNGERAVLTMIRCQLAEQQNDKQLKEINQQLEFLQQTHSDVKEQSLFHYLLALLAKRGNKPDEQVFSHLNIAVDVHFAYNQPTFLLAKTKLGANEMSVAEQLLRGCVNKSSDNAEAYLLLAQILVQKNELDEADKLLDIGLGFNFRVREHPLYFLTKARLEKRANRVDQSIEQLRNALDLFAKKESELELAEAERIAITLELIDSLQTANRIEEADSCMLEAAERYKGKPLEEQQLVLMNAQLRLQRGNVDGAIKVLQAVKPDQPNYRAARIKMAQIYLEEKHDKHRFALCYRDLLEQDTSPQIYELLGDAYISIQEPELAIDAYETAMRRAPKDYQLAEKIGNAYVKCHLYNKAITFYETAMKSSGRQKILRIRFAEQLFQMGNFDKCKRVLKEVLDAETDPSDIQTIREHVSYWMLISRLHMETSEWDQACRDLLKARQLQLRIVGSGGREGLNIAEEKKLAALICQQLAELYANSRDWNKAIELFKEAIGHNERDTKSHLSLAGIYASLGKLHFCDQQCQQVLNFDPNNNDATLVN